MFVIDFFDIVFEAARICEHKSVKNMFVSKITFLREFVTYVGQAKLVLLSTNYLGMRSNSFNSLFKSLGFG